MTVFDFSLTKVFLAGNMTDVPVNKAVDPKTVHSLGFLACSAIQDESLRSAPSSKASLKKGWNFWKKSTRAIRKGDLSLRPSIFFMK
jgi:hypothetical protein